tara:strand:+ start:6945 stop:7289 length:345 start_codon:yes stop_codon:yes gene_type:complete
MTLTPVYTGMNTATGAKVSGEAHLRQSVRDILTTPIGSRVMRRTYGSRLYELMDAPITPGLMALARAFTADALARWEPRLEVIRVVAKAVSGQIEIDLQARFEGREILLSGVGS